MAKKNLGNGFESLEFRKLMAVTVMDVEANDSIAQASSFVPDVSAEVQIVGRSDSDRDKDYFSFTPPADGLWNLSVTSTNHNIPALQVENALGIKVAETDPNDGRNTLQLQVQSGQPVYLRVRSKNDAPAEYIVNLDQGTESPHDTEIPSSATEAELNDSRGQANSFRLGDDDTAQLTGSSTNKDDKDFFVMTTNKVGNLNFQVNSPNGNFAQLEVEDASGNKLTSTEPNDGVQVASLTVSAGQKLYVRMRSKNEQVAEYSVNVTMGEPLPGTHPIAGDADRDGDVDNVDYLILQDHFGQQGKDWHDGDFNGDGTVGSADYVLLSNNWGVGSTSLQANRFQLNPPIKLLTVVPKSPLYGDFDGSGTVDSADLLQLISSWTGADATSTDDAFQLGDIDGDSDCDSVDLMYLIANWTARL